MNHKFPQLIEHTISSTQIAQGKWIKVIHDTVSLPDGSTSYREYLPHEGAVAIIAMDEQDNVIIEYQYRYPVAKVMLEIPAGKFDPNEDDLTCGKRELLEETGYLAQEWIHLGDNLPCIGYSSEKITYFLAKGLTLDKQNLDVGEFLIVDKKPFSELMQMVFAGEIKDGKTMIGLTLAYGYLQKNK